RIEAENVKTGIIKHTNTSYFTMVAKDENEQPTKVPGLILESRDDARRFLEAIKRRELSKRYQMEFFNTKSILSVDEELYLLQDERCKLAF
ncbi:MAG: acyl-CoA thioesterase, partial [Pontibacter sp.]|nr:acyl-CoA thioesterase [Pontibacter sp.]